MKPINEMPREKMIRKGVSSLSDQELLCVILRSGTKNNDIFELSNYILKECGGLKGLGTTRMGELLEIKGIKLGKACSIIAAIELGKRIENESKRQIFRIKSSEDLIELVKDIFNDDYQEQFILVNMDAKGNVISCNKLFVGSTSIHNIYPKDIFREAIKNNASCIAFCHNHPSGDASPSKEDIETTRKLIEISKHFGIKIVEHLIIGKNSVTSLAQMGYISY